MKTMHKIYGFSLVELMVAVLLGLLVSYAVLQIYLAQTQVYRTSNAQDRILNTENAISNIVGPIVRAAGFVGCSSTSTAISVLNIGGPDPLGNFNTTPRMLVGYNGSAATFTITQVNRANSSTASQWSPALPNTLSGQVQQGNDVLIVLGADIDSQPASVTAISSTSSSFSVQSTTNSNAQVGQYAAVSDCVKSVIFKITALSNTNVGHSGGGGTLDNASNTFPVNFQVGAQFMPLQQTAFFVGQGQGGQSSLMRGILSGSTWDIQPIVPGVEFMKVQYGIGSNGAVTRYVSANNVTDWASVYSVRMGFLIAGEIGSGSLISSQFNVLDTQVTVPVDNRLRHVYEMTVQLRNAQ